MRQMKIKNRLIHQSIIRLVLPLLCASFLQTTQAQTKDQDAKASGLTSSAAVIEFSKRPKYRRIRSAAGQELSKLKLAEYVRVTAVVRVADQNNQPLSGKSVTAVARSGAGVAVQGQAETDGSGEAELRLLFDQPLLSLKISVEAWLTEDSSISTGKRDLSLRDWVDFDLSIDFGYRSTPLPASLQALRPRRSLPFNSVNTVIGVATAKLQFNLIEADQRGSYYRLSVYGMIPALLETQSLGLNFFPITPVPIPTQPLDEVAGMGDYAAGINLSLRGNVLADVSYNGRTGKINLADSLRNLGRPRFVDLGDGFESIDSTLELRTSPRESGLFFFVLGGNSHALRRNFNQRESAERDDTYQALGGLGLSHSAGQYAVMVWGGQQRYGAIRFTQNGRTTVTLPSGREWVVGLNETGLTRRRANGGAGLFVGGLGGQQIYFGLSFRLDLNIF